MTVQCHHTQITTPSYSELNKPVIMLLLALVCAISSSNGQAESRLKLEDISQQAIVFTFNHRQTTAIPKRKTDTPQFFNSDELSLETQMAIENDPHLEFNYLWMRQSQNHYRYSDGGAAVGRLFRMGMKTWYKNYRNNNKNVDLPNENGGGSFGSDIDYRLRVSSNRVKLALEYEF